MVSTANIRTCLRCLWTPPSPPAVPRFHGLHHQRHITQSLLQGHLLKIRPRQSPSEKRREGCCLLHSLRSRRPQEVPTMSNMARKQITVTPVDSTSTLPRSNSRPLLVSTRRLQQCRICCKKHQSLVNGPIHPFHDHRLTGPFSRLSSPRSRTEQWTEYRKPSSVTNKRPS